jgi:hypothetical protein
MALETIMQSQSPQQSTLPQCVSGVGTSTTNTPEEIRCGQRLLAGSLLCEITPRINRNNHRKYPLLEQISNLPSSLNKYFVLIEKNKLIINREVIK